MFKKFLCSGQRGGGIAQCPPPKYATAIGLILGSEWLACWTQAVRRTRARVQIAAGTLSGNTIKQTVYTHCASVHQAAKLVAD